MGQHAKVEIEERGSNEKTRKGDGTGDNPIAPCQEKSKKECNIWKLLNRL